MRLTSWPVLTAFGVVVVFLLGWAISSGSHGHGDKGVLVVGRLVDAKSGAPLAGVRVLAVPPEEAHLGSQWNARPVWAEVEGLRLELEEFRAEGEEPDLRLQLGFAAGGRTQEDGTVSFLLSLPWTYYFGALWDSESGSAPEDVMAALWVDRGERGPVMIPVTGTLEEQPGADPLLGTWRIGEIRVP